MQNSSNIKTVSWYIGQLTAKANTDPAWTTYEVTAAEKVLFLIPIAILLPRVVEWWRRKRWALQAVRSNP